MPKSLAHQGMAPGQLCNTEVQLTSDHSLMGSSRPAFIDLCYEGGSFMLKDSNRSLALNVVFTITMLLKLFHYICVSL